MKKWKRRLIYRLSRCIVYLKKTEIVENRIDRRFTHAKDDPEEEEIQTIGFDHFMGTVAQRMKKLSPEDQIVLYDYLINIVIEDACVSKSIVSVYGSDGYDKAILSLKLTGYYDGQRDCFIRMIDDNKKVEIDVKDAWIYVVPHIMERRINAILRLKRESFKQDEPEVCAYYYTDLNLCVVFNHNHHIHAADYYGQGVITCNVCNTELLYPHVTTDGMFWYGTKKNNEKVKTLDFRLATAYALAQKRYFLKKKVESKQRNASLTE